MNKTTLSLISVTQSTYRWLLDALVMDGLLQRRARPCLVGVTLISSSVCLSHDRHIVFAPPFGLAEIRAAISLVMLVILHLPFFSREGFSLLASCISKALPVLVVPGSFLLECLTHNNMVTHST